MLLNYSYFKHLHLLTSKIITVNSTGIRIIKQIFTFLRFFTSSLGNLPQ